MDTKDYTISNADTHIELGTYRDAGPEPDPPAPGWRVAKITLRYYGSHHERDEGDVDWWIALASADIREPVLIHGSPSQMRFVRIWDGEEWVTPQQWTPSHAG